MVSLNRLVPDNPATAVGVATTITLALMMVKTFCLGWIIPMSAGSTRAFGFLTLAVVAGLVAVAFLPPEPGSPRPRS